MSPHLILILVLTPVDVDWMQQLVHYSEKKSHPSFCGLGMGLTTRWLRIVNSLGEFSGRQTVEMKANLPAWWGGELEVGSTTHSCSKFCLFGIGLGPTCRTFFFGRLWLSGPKLCLDPSRHSDYICLDHVTLWVEETQGLGEDERTSLGKMAQPVSLTTAMRGT